MRFLAKILLFSVILSIFYGCSWQSIVTFGMIKSEDEILEQKAREELEKTAQTCEEKRDAIACNNVATNYANLKNFSSAKHFYKISCELDLATACSNLGQIFEYGLDEKNINKELALAYYKLGCASGDGVGCYNEALLTYAQDKRNFSDAIGLFKKSCDFGYKQGCAVLDGLK